MRYFKIVNADGTTPQQGHPWPLPVKQPDGSWTPGAWVEVKRAVKRPLTTADLCTARVLHVVRADQIIHWLIGLVLGIGR